MDIKTFYETVGGSYDEILGRFMQESRVLKFVRRFPADGSFALLKTSLAEGNCEEAFRAAHTLKGIAQNLSFTALYQQVEPLTNHLRGGNMDVGAYLAETERLYELTVSAISQLED